MIYRKSSLFVALSVAALCVKEGAAECANVKGKFFDSEDRQKRSCWAAVEEPFRCDRLLYEVNCPVTCNTCPDCSKQPNKPSGDCNSRHYLDPDDDYTDTCRHIECLSSNPAIGPDCTRQYDSFYCPKKCDFCEPDVDDSDLQYFPESDGIKSYSQYNLLHTVYIGAAGEQLILVDSDRIRFYIREKNEWVEKDSLYPGFVITRERTTIVVSKYLYHVAIQDNLHMRINVYNYNLKSEEWRPSGNPFIIDSVGKGNFLDLSEYGGTIAISDNDNEVIVYDRVVKYNTEIWEPRLQNNKENSLKFDCILQDIDLSDDGNSIAVACGWPNYIKVFGYNTSSKRWNLRGNIIDEQIFGLGGVYKTVQYVQHDNQHFIYSTLINRFNSKGALFYWKMNWNDDIWVQQNADIIGNNDEELGSRMVVSRNGKVVALYSRVGFWTIYYLSGNKWVERNTFEFKGDVDVDLSYDGGHMAIAYGEVRGSDQYAFYPGRVIVGVLAENPPVCDFKVQLFYDGQPEYLGIYRDAIQITMNDDKSDVCELKEETDWCEVVGEASYTVNDYVAYQTSQFAYVPDASDSKVTFRVDHTQQDVNSGYYKSASLAVWRGFKRDVFDPPNYEGCLNFEVTYECDDECHCTDVLSECGPTSSPTESPTTWAPSTPSPTTFCDTDEKLVYLVLKMDDNPEAVGWKLEILQSNNQKTLVESKEDYTIDYALEEKSWCIQEDECLIFNIKNMGGKYKLMYDGFIEECKGYPECEPGGQTSTTYFPSINCP